jgi:transcriptional regulator with XRE-family HTH domain
MKRMARPDKNHPLASWRSNHKRSLQSLADEVGCTQSFLSEVENGNRTPSLKMAARLGQATGIPLDAFVPEDAQ